MAKKCKHCKEKFEPLHFNQKFCFKEECKKVWIEQEKAKQWVKRKKQMKEELETVQSLMKKAQKVFNEYIRLRDKDKPCISCGRELKGKPVNASHFYSAGGHYSVRFDEDNVHSSCVNCNMYLSGNLEEYSRRLPDRIGMERYEGLRKRAHDIRNFNREELNEIISSYRKKIKKWKNGNQ